jgi:hypothetical protein
MFDIDKTRNAIAEDRRKAGWFKLGAYAMECVAIAVLVTGMIKSLALTRSEFIFHIFPEFWAFVCNWMDDWSFFWWILPYPRMLTELPTSLSAVVSWLGWFVLVYGLYAFGFRLWHESESLSKRAYKAQEQLDFLELQGQSTQGGDISGNRNVFVTAVNTINTTLERNEKKNWCSITIIPIVVGVVINIISKFLGVS